MPIRMSDFIKRTKKIVVEFQGDLVDIEYFINAITPAFLSTRTFVDQVKIAVSDWDVLDEDGNKLPVAESANLLSVDFLHIVIEQIIKDVRGGIDDDQKKV
ncbi:MAG: hypothetical protein U1B80_02905 [Anaerolineaceae bacterium]|nr:hypothetical protein [Anaerolineaceae bacterium]